MQRQQSIKLETLVVPELLKLVPLFQGNFSQQLQLYVKVLPSLFKKVIFE